MLFKANRLYSQLEVNVRFERGCTFFRKLFEVT